MYLFRLGHIFDAFFDLIQDILLLEMKLQFLLVDLLLRFGCTTTQLFIILTPNMLQFNNSS